MDEIFIKDLLIQAIIGINPAERVTPQDVLINVTLFVDTRPAARSDDIADAVNYGTLAKQIRSFVATSNFFLIEKLAAEIMNLCLIDPRVTRARVTVEKPTILRDAKSAGVTIERERDK